MKGILESGVPTLMLFSSCSSDEQLLNEARLALHLERQWRLERPTTSWENFVRTGIAGRIPVVDCPDDVCPFRVGEIPDHLQLRTLLSHNGCLLCRSKDVALRFAKGLHIYRTLERFNVSALNPDILPADVRILQL
jgi:hypothetical protein